MTGTNATCHREDQRTRRPRARGRPSAGSNRLWVAPTGVLACDGCGLPGEHLATPAAPAPSRPSLTAFRAPQAELLRGHGAILSQFLHRREVGQATPGHGVLPRVTSRSGGEVGRSHWGSRSSPRSRYRRPLRSASVTRRLAALTGGPGGSRSPRGERSPLVRTKGRCWPGDRQRR